jgi:hypothetical protein
MEFIYSSTFSGRIRKELRITQKVLLTHEVSGIQSENIRRKAQENSIRHINIKRQRLTEGKI